MHKTYIQPFSQVIRSTRTYNPPPTENDVKHHRIYLPDEPQPSFHERSRPAATYIHRLSNCDVLSVSTTFLPTSWVDIYSCKYIPLYTKKVFSCKRVKRKWGEKTNPLCNRFLKKWKFETRWKSWNLDKFEKLKKVLSSSFPHLLVWLSHTKYIMR